MQYFDQEKFNSSQIKAFVCKQNLGALLLLHVEQTKKRALDIRPSSRGSPIVFRHYYLWALAQIQCPFPVTSEFQACICCTFFLLFIFAHSASFSSLLLTHKHTPNLVQANATSKFGATNEKAMYSVYLNYKSF